MDAQLGELYCPVCGDRVQFIRMWQEPTYSRIRLFCEQCSHRDEYRELPRAQRTIHSLQGFQRFAARPLLAHVREREVAKQSGGAGAHGA